ncbi:MAG: tyrosine-protein phosphatase [Rhodoglobus sp.]
MFRAVHWGGIHNARDLGGLTGRLGTTKPGRVFRMPRPDDLDAAGWQELESAGIKTLIDLRNPEEIATLPLRPAMVASVNLAIEDQTDREFMDKYLELLGSPAYFAENLRRWPTKVAAALSAVADAPKGGVAIHCAAGRDRTGLIVALILDLCGVDRVQILDDYERGVRETNDYLLSVPAPHERPRAPQQLAEALTKDRATLAELLDSLDLSAYLQSAGVDLDAQSRLRERLLV